MMTILRAMGSFLSELKRRKVYQATAIYLALTFGGLELLDLLIPSTRLPEWAGLFFLSLSIVGLPLVIVFAWTFDITPHGVRRTSSSESSSRAGPQDLPAGPVNRGDGEEEKRPEDRTRQDSAPSESRTPAPLALDPTAVAVLPFENLSGAADADPFAAGLHDDLLTELSRASALTVISRTSVSVYRGSQKTIRQIAQELGAGSVIEGGVQRAGNRVRLNVQLIDAQDDAQRWAERFDRELTPDNIFELQSELAEKIMAALKTHLTSEEEERHRVRPTDDLEAYRLYAMGRKVSIERSDRALQNGIELFRSAVERDPDYALAWAGLGGALTAFLDYGHTDSESLLKEARDACARALSLDPELPEAHAAQGGLLSYLRDCPGALAAHSRASELSPSYAGAHQWTCWVQTLMGRGEEALAAARKATRLDPLDPEARGNLAMSLLAVDDPDQALVEAGKALEAFPGFDYARWVEGLALLSMGRGEEGNRTLQRLTERWARSWPHTSRALDAVARGHEEEARESLPTLADTSRFSAGLVHAAMGELDQAFEAIRAAGPLPWDETLYLRFYRPGPMASLRQDRRFPQLISELNRSWGMEEQAAG